MTYRINSLWRAAFASVLLAAFIASQHPVARGQSSEENLDRFEVASIRPAGENDGRPGIQFLPGGGLRATNVTLKLLIQAAYQIRSEQVSGGEKWTDSNVYTVFAKPSEDSVSMSPNEQNALVLRRLRSLLRERFNLQLRHEDRLSEGYVITVEKTGHKMTISHDEGPPLIRQVGRWEIRAERVQIPLLVRFLSAHLNTPVEDRTDLKDRFDFRLTWAPESVPANIAELDNAPEDSLIAAVRDQLGLRLQRQKVRTDYYIIERVDKPTEN